MLGGEGIAPMTPTSYATKKDCIEVNLQNRMCSGSFTEPSDANDYRGTDRVFQLN